VTGIDLSPVMIDTARRLAGEQSVGIRFEVGDAESLPYDDASFDVVAAPDPAITHAECGGTMGAVAGRLSAGRVASQRPLHRMAALYVALHDGTVKQSADGGRTWRVRVAA